MLTPLIAFGLFGNIVQLVQFSKDLNLEAHEIQATGSSRSQDELSHLIWDAFEQIGQIKVLFADTLERQKKHDSNSPNQEPHGLIDSCEKIHKNLRKCMDDRCIGAKCMNEKCMDKKCMRKKCMGEKCMNEKCMDKKCMDEKCMDKKCMDEKCMDKKCMDKKCMDTGSNPLKISKWKSIRETVVLMLKRNSVEKYVRRLERLRNELSFHVIISIRSEISETQKNHEQVIQQLSGLREVVQKIVDSTGGNTKDAMQSLLSNIKEDVQNPAGHTIDRTEDLTQDFHLETNVV